MINMLQIDSKNVKPHNYLVVVVLPDPFQGMRQWRNSMEIQQLGHAPRSRPEVKIGRSSAKNGALERLRYGTIQEEVNQILHRVSAGTARRILSSVLPCVGKRTREGCDRGRKVGTVHSGLSSGT